ncbi:Teichoic acid export ATP-binding protein TagH [hydrothermal vent metagenome]|uniref:Teichoic acid export ATP-binding protein TagH n=1 Tax=hydrothermal vent metagenome TaxID=652676 RepID=A0A3B0VZJ7_9ZZZZ
MPSWQSHNGRDNGYTEMELMSFDNVGLSFKRQNKKPYWALKQVSFNILEGETLGVIGSNGAGKSTLLRIIAGTYIADKGKIVRNTESCALLSLQLGFVPYLNGIDNLILSGMLQGLDKKYIISRIPAILDFSELREMIKEPINTWSTGMVARLGFTLALEIKPKILLIDESLSVGDASFAKKSTAAIKQRIKSNQTVVLVSHSTKTIKELCNRVLWIENGTTKTLGSTLDVLQQYEQFVAASVGKKIWR